MTHSPAMDSAGPPHTETSQYQCLETWPRKTRGYAVKAKSCATRTSFSRLRQLFRVGPRPTTSEMIRCIDEYRNRFPVEFIGKTLKHNGAGGFITSRGYRQSKPRELKCSSSSLCCAVERMNAVHRDNYGIYGVRIMWHALRRASIDIGREQTARLMLLAGVSGKDKNHSHTSKAGYAPGLGQS